MPRFKVIPDQITFFKQSKVLKLVQTEMASLIYSDAVDYPVLNSVFPENAPDYKDLVYAKSLNEAKRLVDD